MAPELPTPKVRTAWRYTVHGGWNWKATHATIPDGQGGTMPATGWAQHQGNLPDQAALAYTVTECTPRVIEGTVRKLATGATGHRLVYVGVGHTPAVVNLDNGTVMEARTLLTPGR